MPKAKGSGVNAEQRAEPKRRKGRNRRYCCVVDCHEQEGRDPDVHFYQFPAKSYEVERRKLWIQAVRRLNPDGTPWLPTLNSRICSRHFVGNKKSTIQYHPAYLPTIFPPCYNRPPPRDYVRKLERLLRCTSRGVHRPYQRQQKKDAGMPAPNVQKSTEPPDVCGPLLNSPDFFYALCEQSMEVKDEDVLTVGRQSADSQGCLGVV